MQPIWEIEPMQSLVYSLLFQKKVVKKSKHPISQDRKVVYMVQALLASFQNSHITLQSWLIGFLIFF